MATEVSKAKRKLLPAETEKQEALQFINNKSCKRRRTKAVYGIDEKQKRCHQCHRNQRDRVIQCRKCRSNHYCVNCFTKWYPNVSEEKFVEACPVCCNNCNCKACLVGFSAEVMQGYSCSKTDKIQYSKYILQKVLPLVRRLNEEQLMEKEIEAKVRGLSLSELQLQEVECPVDEDIYCDNCGAYFFDMYRTCYACDYDLCLKCCSDLRDGHLEGGKGMSCGWKSCKDGSIPCPPKDIGGCSDGILELQRIMPVDWIVNMLDKAQGIYKMITSDDDPQSARKCCMCYDYGNEKCNASYFYSLSAKDIQPGDMEHFQSHWSKGEPIIVSDVLSTSSGLSWEPMVLGRVFHYIIQSSSCSHGYEVDAIHCLDWRKVTIDLYKFFKGYSEGLQKREGQPVILKLEDWQPSCFYEGKWPRHFVEFLGCLPFKDYTHPNNGYMNVAKLPDISLKPDMGPRMDIAYGVEEEWEYGNSVTKLHYEKSDTVNVLTHTKSALLTSAKLRNMKMVKQKHGDQDETLVCMEGLQRDEDDHHVVHTMKEGALWDIFQRQDIPKLEKYLMNHSTEFRHGDRLSVEQIVHPIHDRIFYLNMEHKQKLKAEFGIEPWTFKQKLGDAVFIPAGCPYQVRNLKSCTNVELNFVSPESLDECIYLQHELRILPNNHIAKQDNLNIEKMMLYAVADLAGVGDLRGPIDDIHFAKTLIADGANIYNHTNGWLDDTESNDNKEDSRTKLVTVIGSDSNTKTRSCSPIDIGTHEDSGMLMSDEKTSKDPHEPVGLWRGNAVGLEAKELLEAVENRYPDTFQGVHIRAKSILRSILKEFHVVIKGFVETSVDALTEEQITSFQQDLNEFEKFGFDISWARKRLDMVERLKFGKEPLQQELMALEEALKPLKERFVEAHEMLKKARLEYKKGKYARKRKAEEVAQKFGAEYDQVLKGCLGLGMLPGY